jgi:2-oxoglutarate ferredoxin oxidoreductase subunit alpha
MGALSKLFNIPESSLKHVIEERFHDKDDTVIAANHKAFEQGLACAEELKKTDSFTLSNAGHSQDVIVISGNEAVGLGAILGQLDFFSAYPITPATEIAKYVSEHIPKTGGTLIQAEDEIASIGQVLGASYAGKRSMTATSGPGLALMSEMLGMCSMSETPALVVNVQRGGPSTGLPTKHEQSDLFLAIHGSHGDAPRIVLSVENVHDCITMTVDALNLAESYQCPVILLTDGSLAFSNQTIPYPDPAKFTIVHRKHWDGQGEYKRYLLTEDGISPMADPGTPGGMHIATGLEHNEKGAPQYDPENREKMQAKRFKKLTSVVNNYPAIEVDSAGNEDADLGIIAWGSTIGVVREAVQRLRNEGFNVSGFYPKLLWPMPVEQYEAFAAKCKQVLIPEVNYQGQLAHFVRAETSIRPVSYTICGGLPFSPSMIVAKVKEMLK